MCTYKLYSEGQFSETGADVFSFDSRTNDFCERTEAEIGVWCTEMHNVESTLI